MVSQKEFVALFSDMFAWNQTLFRVVNAGKYSSVNIDLDVQYSTNKLTVGASHTLQQLINMTVADQGISATSPVFVGYDSVQVGTDWHYSPTQAKTVDGQDSTQTVVYNYIRDGISVDGTNFLNLATNSTKLYIDYKPASWITLHTSARVFWGLIGRKDIHEFDTTSNTNAVLDYASNNLARSKSYPYLGIHSDPMVKMNLGVTFGDKDDKLKVSFHVYDLLAGNGSSASLHSLRWQQSFDATSTTDLFAMDYRSYALKLTYNF